MQFLWFLFWRGSFVQQSAFLIFYKKRQRLSNSLSITSISLLPFLSFSRYSLMNCFIISSQNTFARHPEAPRITTARSLVESVESSRCASILGISTSLHEGFSTPMALFFFRHIHTMRSVGGRNSAGFGASGCIWHGFGLDARIVSFVQQQSLENTTSSPGTAKISVTKIGQRRNLKTAAIHSFCPLHLLLVWQLFPALCPCTLPSSLPAVHLREGNSGSRPIQSSAIAF